MLAFFFSENLIKGRNFLTKRLFQHQLINIQFLIGMVFNGLLDFFAKGMQEPGRMEKMDELVQTS